jgi:ABC-2 type transport system ATP-binding protein
VGALLDAGYVHPGRSGRNHLRWLAASNGISRSRVDEVLELVGLDTVAGRRVRTYSLGMRQRLGLAGVLLGDPHTVVLDEPANGLDPEGIRWIRDVLVHLASQGRTVLVSSHLLSEMAQMANDLVVIGQGRLIEQCTVPEFVERHADRWVRVTSPAVDVLAGAATAQGATASRIDSTTAELRGISAVEVGELAARNGIVLHELSPQTGSLEDAFLQATAAAQEFASRPVGGLS